MSVKADYERTTKIVRKALQIDKIFRHFEVNNRFFEEEEEENCLRAPLPKFLALTDKKENNCSMGVFCDHCV